MTAEEACPITGKTKILGLIGHPVAQSLSPQLHNEAFMQNGQDYRYVTFDVEPDNLAAAVEGIRALGIAGGNITVPHKAAVLPLLDSIDPAAQLAGAVNTFVMRDGSLVGYNTDGISATDSLAAHAVPVQGARIVVIDVGAEGSAITARTAVEGAAHIDVFTTPGTLMEAARTQAKQVEHATNATVAVHDLGNVAALRTALLDADILVDASRIGAAPEIDACPVPEEALHAGLAVVETIYDPPVTRLLSAAEAAGCVYIDGVELLQKQAACARSIWTAVQ